MNCANHPDRERVAFCQNCGNPLCSECTRTIGTAVFCEPCLAARLAAADTASSSSGTPYGNVNVPYGASANAIPPVPGAPNPALAGLLGLIPGVGAMYNGQYAKGVVHLVIFAVLVSLSNTNGLFGLFVAGWVFYQVFEAYHTARARRDGTPLPNPFGLNDVGEKLGFNKSWTAPAVQNPVPPTADPTSVPPPFTQTPDVSQNFNSSYGAGYAQNVHASQNYTAPVGSDWSAPSGSYVPPNPTMPPYSVPYAVPGEDPVPASNRFPVGAILLIVFGILFFFGSSGWFAGFPIQRVIPFILIAVGVWIFVRKMTGTGQGLADDGTPAYRVRIFRALRGSIWVILVGVLFLLDTFDILSWSHSWPLFIIVAGLMTFLERSAYGSVPPPAYYPAYPAGPNTPPSSVPPSAGTSIVPVSTHDEEGR